MAAHVRVRRNFHLRDIVRSPPVPVTMMQAQGERALSSLQERIASGQDQRGRPFTPLSPQYAKTKARRYPGRPILVRTGEMMADLVVRATSTMFRLEWGSAESARKAGWHQRGTRKMPARPFQGITDKLARDIRMKIRSQVRLWLRGRVR